MMRTGDFWIWPLGRQFAAAIADAQTYEAERRRAEALAEIDRAASDRILLERQS